MAVLGFIFLHDAAEMPERATIVVLSAGQELDGTIGPSTRMRMDAGLRLYRQMPPETRMLMTGGVYSRSPISLGEAMAEYAARAGVPRDNLLIEPAAQSTLQNALFSFDILGPDPGPVIVVTHRFHLPRSWASFRWAGFRDIHLYPMETGPMDWNRYVLKNVLMEALKIPGNLLRALIADLRIALGRDPATPDPWLR